MIKTLLISAFLCLSVCLLNAQNVDTLTVGRENCDYININSALADLYVNGVNDSTIICLTESYNPSDSVAGESLPITINKIPGSSPENKVILTVDENVHVTFRDSLQYIAILSGVSDFEIVGKNRISFYNDALIDNSAPLYIENNATNLVIDGCNFYAGSNLANTFGIYVSNILNNDKYSIFADLTISNNVISRAKTAVALDLTSENSVDIVISDNIIGDVRSDYAIGETGIKIVSHSENDSINITNNKVFCIGSPDFNTSIVTGVYVNCLNYLEINNNLVLDVVNFFAEGNAVGMAIDNKGKSLIYNNMISHVAAEYAVGIDINDQEENSFADLFFNSIYLCEDNSKNFFGKLSSNCFEISNISSKGKLQLRNNILQNNFGDIYNQANTPASAINLWSDDKIADIIGTSFICDHNIFYIDDMADGYVCRFHNSIGGTIDTYSIDEWNELNNDTTCLSKDPKFSSTSLLKIDKYNAAGIHVNGIETDFFGTQRNDTTPDVGAHELPHETGIYDRENNIVALTVYSFENKIVVDSKELLFGEIYVYDMTGRVVVFSTISDVHAEIPFFGNSGIYILSYRGAEKHANVKFVRNR